MGTRRVPAQTGVPGSLSPAAGVRAAAAPRARRSAASLSSQLVYMGFDALAAEAALRLFRGNLQLAAQTLAHNGGGLPPDLQLAAEDCSSSTPSTSPSDSAGGSAVAEVRWRRAVGAAGKGLGRGGGCPGGEGGAPQGIGGAGRGGPGGRGLGARAGCGPGAREGGAKADGAFHLLWRRDL